MCTIHWIRLVAGVVSCFHFGIGQTQTLLPQGQLSAGGHAENAGVHLGWSLGQAASATYASTFEQVTAGIQQPEGVILLLNIRALLDGPFKDATGLMADGLRALGLVPLHEPYSESGYAYSGFGAVGPLAPILLAHEGPDAIVDWVVVELRDASDAGQVISSRPALVQRDGDVVEVDATGPVRISVLPGAYHIAVLHRNHLGVMTALPVELNAAANIIDLTDGSTQTYGTDAQRLRAGVRLLWAGDVTSDGLVKYTGANNDRDPVLQVVGGVVPTATTSGYHPADVNLDGTVKYTGADNDRDPILQTVGGSVPTATRSEQLP